MVTVIRKKPKLTTRVITWGSWAYLFILLVICTMLFGISENWWLSSALTYTPRQPWLMPAGILLVTSILWHRSSILINLISLTMVVVPIMGLSLPISHWLSNRSGRADDKVLKVVSCNVQNFRPDFDSVLSEIDRFDPDLVLFQDASIKSAVLAQYFRSWHVVRRGEYFLASRYPARLVDVGHLSAFDRDTVMQCELALPTTSVIIFNVHQRTPRQGLESIRKKGGQNLSRFLDLRSEETRELRDFVEGGREDMPTLITGDFNMPMESSLYRRHWSDYQNAFAVAGFGYGYSFPCTRQYCWPAGLPWMRLDHILVDEAWQVRQCFVGNTNGSDHRLIAATLELR